MKANYLLPVIIVSLFFAGKSYAFTDEHMSENDILTGNETKYLLDKGPLESGDNDRNQTDKKDKPLYILASNDRPDEPPKVKNNPPVINNNKEKVVIDNNTITSQFESNKGLMSWPVNNGYVATPFGKYNHPFEAKVTLENYGIDIAAKEGSAIQNIFQGTVCRIENIGGTYTVIVNHGGYYSVYSYLSKVAVKVGDQIHSHHNIGTIGNNDDGKPMLHFEICKLNGTDIVNENPGYWISKK